MFKKLEAVEKRFHEIEHQLQDPSLSTDDLRKLSKEHSDLREIVDTYQVYKKTNSDLTEAKAILSEESDADMREIAKEEIASLEPEIERLETELNFLLLPKDPNDGKNVVLEIRGGAGGDEAALFAGDLYRMYQKYADRRGWRVETLSISGIGIGGVKEVSALITGDKVYSRLRNEAGVHRVQRVPDTESQGRIHTSTVTVAVMAEAEEVDIKINPTDLKIDVFRAGGAGGQHVNTTDSAVRITHIPTGTVVSIQDEKSQHKNKEKALKILRSRILDAEQAKAAAEHAATRKAMVGTGDRSERIRTYNFPQSRVTDHRIGLTLHSLDAVMEGDVDQVIDPLLAHYQAELLKNSADYT